MNIHQKIQAARLAKGWSMMRLAEEISRLEGLSPALTWQTVQQWESGRSAPKRTRLGTVGTALGVNLMEETPAGSSSKLTVLSGDEPPVRLVPVIGQIRCGADGYLEELQSPDGDGSIQYWTRDPEAYAWRVKGDSMHPRYRAREFIVVTPHIDAQQGTDVVVRFIDGREILKTLNWQSADEIQLLSLVDGLAPQTIDRSEIDVVQRVGACLAHDARIENTFTKW